MEISWKIAALKNFKELTVKKLCQNLSFNKVTGFRPSTLLKRDSGTNIFLRFFKNFLQNTFERLLLNKKLVNQGILYKFVL